MSHAETLKRNGLPTMQTLVARILRTFDAATASDLESGARWYDDAGNLAASFVSPDLSLEQAASVIAALSPRTSWARNVAGATALIQSGPSAARKIGCMSREVERARTAKREGFSALPEGKKTRYFAQNIAGDREAVTVDVWAMRVIDLDENLLNRVGVYAAVAHAYRLAAGRRGVDPATMQATTWVVKRGGRAS